MYKHVKEANYYERLYDELTVYGARRDMVSFLDFRDKYLDIMKDAKPSKFRETLHLNWFYMIMVGNELVSRYNEKDHKITEMKVRDQEKDEKIESSRLQFEPSCHHCDKQGLRIIDKSLMHRDDSKEDEVLIMLKCPSCKNNSAMWDDGIAWERLNPTCEKCSHEMSEKSSKKDKVITTKYTCEECSHSFSEKLDLNIEEKKVDPVSRYLFMQHLVWTNLSCVSSRTHS